MVENKSRDGRKKLHDEVDIWSELTLDSCIDREIFELEEAFYSYWKRLSIIIWE